MLEFRSLGLALVAGSVMAATDLLFRKSEANNGPILLSLECALVASNR